MRPLLIAILLSLSLLAQFDTGQIAGFIRDSSESTIAGATVTVRNENTGEEKTTKTNASGYYVFPSLLVGTYSLSAESAGFKKVHQSGIGLSSASKLSVDLQLTVGAVTETVEVKATVGLVQAESAVVGRTINSKQVADLTLNGRNPIYLALLKPGVRGGSIGAFDPDSVSNGGFSINGGRADEYVVMVDGAVATRTRSSGSMLGSQDVDTIEEVGPGGHFFGTAHTQARYRDAFYRPILSDWRNYESWEEAGRPTADQKAKRLVGQYLDAYQEPTMDPDVKAELRAFVDRRVAEGGVPTDF